MVWDDTSQQFLLKCSVKCMHSNVVFAFNMHNMNARTDLFVFLVLEPEGGLYAAPLVQEAPPHVNVSHVARVPRNIE